MKIARRGFLDALGAIAAAPFLPPLPPSVVASDTIHANVLAGTGTLRSLTEEMLIEATEMQWRPLIEGLATNPTVFGGISRTRYPRLRR